MSHATISASSHQDCLALYNIQRAVISFDKEEAGRLFAGVEAYLISVISHCESRALSENSARYDVTLYMTMF